MGNLARVHECQCYLELAPDGYAEGGAIVVRALLVANKPGKDNKPEELGVSMEWPTKEGHTFEGVVLNVLYQLDHVALVQWWWQGDFVRDA